MIVPMIDQALAQILAGWLARDEAGCAVVRRSQRAAAVFDPDEANDLGLGADVDEIVCRQCLGAEEEAGA